MKILSIQLWHNATVAYSEDWELKYVLQEEKFDNVKNSSNFPLNSIKYIASKFDLSDLDKVIHTSATLHSHFLVYKDNYKPEKIIKNSFFKISFYDYWMYFLTKYFSWVLYFIIDKKINFTQKNNLDNFVKLISDWLWYSFDKNKIEFVEHHICHALSPIYFYWLYNYKEPTLIFTLDWSGDKYCASVRLWKNWILETLSTTRYFNSLWYLWANITSWFWMKPLEHEYKIMWLAAYTDENYYWKIYSDIFSEIMWIDWLEWKAKFPTNRAYMYFKDKFYWNRFDNIAWALQYMTEKLVLEWIENAIKLTWIKNIATSWWVFMNVKLNKKIQEADFIEKVYFMPSCWDESNVIWWLFAWYLNSWLDITKLNPLNSMYYWIDYTDEEISKFVNELDLDKYSINNLDSDENSAKVISNMLANFEIVWVVRWKWEWWARSLCNRAILANASDLKTFHEVNDMIKMRDFWMPFAPVILDDFAWKYIKDWNILWNKSSESHKYMISAVDSTVLAQEHLRASIHQKDKTLRPQIVSIKDNKWLYDLINNYKNLTWFWWMMNTSLNIHGYPLVWTLDQAMFTLNNSWLKNLLIWNYLIIKK